MKKIFWLIEIIYNIVSGNLFPVLTNPSIYYPFAYYGGIFFIPGLSKPLHMERNNTQPGLIENSLFKFYLLIIGN